MVSGPNLQDHRYHQNLNFALQGLSPEVDDLTTRASKFSAQLKATVCQIFSFLFEINTIVVIIATCMMTRYISTYEIIFSLCNHPGRHHALSLFCETFLQILDHDLMNTLIAFRHSPTFMRHSDKYLETL